MSDPKEILFQEIEAFKKSGTQVSATSLLFFVKSFVANLRNANLNMSLDDFLNVISNTIERYNLEKGKRKFRYSEEIRMGVALETSKAEAVR